MNYFRIYYDLFTNIFIFLILELLVEFFEKKHNIAKMKKMRIYFILYLIVYAIIPEVPFGLTISIAVDFLYICLATDTSIWKKIKLFIKCYLCTYGLLSVILLTDVFILHDDAMFTSTELYTSYKALTCLTVTYITLNLYINYKRISAFQSGKIYVKRFNLISIVCIAALFVACMLLETSFIPQEQVLPLIFSLLVIISIMCLSAYKQVIITVQENTERTLQLEKNRLEKNYMDSVEASLQQLRTTRHDLKNHLIIIDGYAKEGKQKQISEYIQKISSTIEQSDTICTPSVTISSLLNAKQQLCNRHHILLKYAFRFDAVYIDDYSLITILGNIMDNAITAASKLDNGYIQLKIFQLDSQLNIYCENNHCESVIEKDGHFISSKQEPDAIHGLGIRSVRKTVSDLNGTIDIEYSDSRFCVDILIPNYI